jgi:uracil-DNA glycosylase family 4
MENYSKDKIVDILRLLKYMGFDNIDASLLNISNSEDLENEIRKCTKCELHKERTNTVFGKGPLDADILIIGEAPGREEDIQGIPFVGAAGKKLDAMLSSAGIEPSKVFITNVVKCRPPGNRNPELDEIMKCNPYLIKQIQMIKPKIIVLLGNVPLSLVSGEISGITKTRGKRLEYMSYPAIPTFHPAYVVRNPGSEKTVVEDFKKVIRSVA